MIRLVDLYRLDVVPDKYRSDSKIYLIEEEENAL